MNSPRILTRLRLGKGSQCAVSAVGKTPNFSEFLAAPHLRCLRHSAFTHLRSPSAITSTVGALEELSPENLNQSTRCIFEGLINGSRAHLSQAITLVESTNKAHAEEARKLITLTTRHTRDAEAGSSSTTLRIGLSGPPGAGKSTFIEGFGRLLTSKGLKVAVLAVDPSSTRGGGGSLLGDKTRMPELARDPLAFIRPSPNKGHLGGVTRSTNDAVVLCEACKYNVILIETVGVGQSEIAVADMVDAFCLLLPPGSGDELQGLKRGIIELCDFVLVNKSDGDLLPAARRTTSEYVSALKFIRPKWKAWKPEVIQVSARTGNGLPQTWERLGVFKDLLIQKGEFDKQRRQQRMNWMWNYINYHLRDMFNDDESVKRLRCYYEDEVSDLRISPGAASDQLIETFVKSLGRREGRFMS